MEDVPTIQDLEQVAAFKETNKRQQRNRKSARIAIIAVVLILALVILGVLAYVLIKRGKKLSAAFAPSPSNASAFPLRLKSSNEPYYPSPLADSLALSKYGVKMKTVSTSPHIQTIDDFLDMETCAELIAYASPNLKRSTVVDNRTGKNVHDPARTSFTVFFEKNETPTLKRIQGLAAKLANVDEQYLEGLQVVRYMHGQFYRAHHDYLPRSSEDVKTRGQRTVTMFVYLNDLPENEIGGGTHFPTLNMTFKPKAGSAVLWHNMRDGVEDPRTLHSGEPVQKEGSVKYGLNIWVREYPQSS